MPKNKQPKATGHCCGATKLSINKKDGKQVLQDKFKSGELKPQEVRELKGYFYRPCSKKLKDGTYCAQHASAKKRGNLIMWSDLIPMKITEHMQTEFVIKNSLLIKLEKIMDLWNSKSLIKVSDTYDSNSEVESIKSLPKLSNKSDSTTSESVIKKVNSDSDSNSDSNSDTNSDTNSDSNSDTDSDSDSDSKLDSKSDSKLDSKLDSKSDSKLDSKSDSKSDSNSDTDSEDKEDDSDASSVKSDSSDSSASSVIERKKITTQTGKEYELDPKTKIIYDPEGDDHRELGKYTKVLSKYENKKPPFVNGDDKYICGIYRDLLIKDDKKKKMLCCYLSNTVYDNKNKFVGECVYNPRKRLYKFKPRK